MKLIFLVTPAPYQNGKTHFGINRQQITSAADHQNGFQRDGVNFIGILIGRFTRVYCSYFFPEQVFSTDFITEGAVNHFSETQIEGHAVGVGTINSFCEGLAIYSGCIYIQLF